MANTATLQDVLDRYTDLTANEITAITNFYNTMVSEGLWPRFVDIFFFSLLTENNARIGALRWEFNRTLGVATHVPGQGFTFESGASLYQVHNQGNSYKSSDLGAALDTEFGSTNHGMGHKVTRLVEDPALAHVDYFGSSSDGGTTIRQHEGSTRLQAQVGSNANYRFLGALPYTYTPQHLVFDRRGDGNVYYWDSLGKFEVGPEPVEDPLEEWRDDRPIFINGRATSPSGSVNAHPSDHEFHYVFHQDGTLDDKAFAAIDVAFVQFLQEVNAPISKTVIQNYTPSWEVFNFVFDNYQTVWNTLELVSNDYQVVWDFAAFVDADLTVNWDVANFVTADYQVDWNVLNLVSNSYQATWHVSTGTSNSLTVVWNVQGTIRADYRVDWNVLNFVFDNHTTSWDVFNFVTNTYVPTWHVANILDSSYTSTWNNLNFVSQDYTAVWDIQSDFHSKSLEVVWNVESTAGTTPNRVFYAVAADRMFSTGAPQQNEFSPSAENRVFDNVGINDRQFVVDINGILQERR